MAEGSFTYFNKNNGDVNTFPRQHARLEALQNWVTVTDEAHLAELQATYEGRPARSGLLGSPGVGDRVQPDPVVEAPDPEPEIVPDPPDPEPDPVVEPDPEPITPLDPADRPARSAVRAEWVKWAVKSGASVADAESMTKSDLIEVYGE